jgi:hypothetical protein
VSFKTFYWPWICAIMEIINLKTVSWDFRIMMHIIPSTIFCGICDWLIAHFRGVSGAETQSSGKWV